MINILWHSLFISKEKQNRYRWLIGNIIFFYFTSLKSKRKNDLDLTLLLKLDGQWYHHMIVSVFPVYITIRVALSLRNFCALYRKYFFIFQEIIISLLHTFFFIHFVSLQNGFQPSFVYGECIKKIICWLFTVLWKNYNPQVENAILISICSRIVPHSLLISFIINSNAFWKLYLLKFMAMRYWTFNGPKQVFLLRFVETNICIIF